MSLLEQTPGLLDALRGELTPKFLATRSVDGIPNIVPCVSLLPADDQPDTVFFGNFLLRKSIKNLQQDARVGLLVITPELRGWRLTGDFVEFQRTGPYVEQQMSSSLLRYNAYTGVRNAGVIRVRSVEGRFAISRLQVAKDFALARLAALMPHKNDGIALPLAVRREFARMVAVKVLAWIGEDGYPNVIPMLSLQPADDRSLACWQGSSRLPSPSPDAPVAANILTFEAISYQAKGRWSARGRQGAIAVQEVYAGGPPYPGGRVA
jgi:hypothetical protein